MSIKRQLLVYWIVGLSVVMVSFSLALSGLAGTSTQVPFKTGFLGPLNKGLPLSGAGIYLSSPTLADLNHDGKQEILIGSGRDMDGLYRGNSRIHVVSHTGALLWSVQPRPTAEIGPGEVQPPINAALTVLHDINGDGWDEIVVALGGEATTGADNWDGGVAAYSGQTGTRLWVFNSDDWNGHVPDGHADGVFSTPAIGDVDGDSDEEIAFGSWDQCIYLLNHQGNPLWSNTRLPEQGHCHNNQGYYNEDTVWSSPVLADLNGDDQLEVIIGADVSPGNVYGDPAGGYLYVFSATGAQLGRAWVNQAIYSAPAVGDLDNDGQLEIVVGSGVAHAGVGYYVKAWEYTPGMGLSLKWSATTAGQVFGSPALGDLNQDGVLDVVAISYNADVFSCINQGARLYAWRGSNGAPLTGFPASPKTMQGANDQCVSSSPVLVDIDNDNRLEVLFAYGWEVTIFNHDGTQYTDSALNGTKPTFQGYGPMSGAPAVGDLDQNGQLEVVLGGVHDATDYPGGDNWRTGALKVWQTTAAATNHRPWPMFRQNAQHTGVYDPPRLAVQPESLFALHAVGQTNPEKITMVVKNEGQESFTWTSSKPANVTLSPASGIVITQVLVQVTINTTGYTAAGTYPLGNVIITASGIGGSPKTLPVTLRVAILRKNFLPLVLKGS